MKAPVDFALLAEVLDSIDDAFCVADRLGRIRHENMAFARILNGGTEVELVRDEVRRLARSVILHNDPETHGATSLDGGRAVEFSVGKSTYRARASLMRKSATDASALALITLELVPTPSIAEHVRVKHRLTPREVQVVELIAEGHSNQSVATALGMSTHTARHHTGRVLSKLQARGRAEVGAMVRRLHR